MNPFMSKKTYFLIFLVVFIIFFIPQVSAHELPNVIHVSKNGFEPPNLTINLGDTVTFENTDSEDRWPASNIHPTHEIYPEFDPKQAIKPTESWEFKFEKSGRFTYHDHLFPNFRGEIEVLGQNTMPKFNIQSFLENFLDYINTFWVRLTFKFNLNSLKNELTSINMVKVAETNQSKLKFYLKILGHQAVMDRIIKDSKGGSEIDCHQAAHQTGRISFMLFGNNVFKKSNHGCHSGFIHGAMETFLKEKGTQNLAQNIDRLCDSLDTSFSRFECLHGVGHGLMAYENYDLKKSLDDCNLLDDSFSQSSCYGGVFMENIVASQGRGALIGHETKWISSDPHFPCDEIDKASSVQVQCYLMQTSRMLDIYKYDVKKVADECRKAPDSMVTVCFQSLGRDIAGFTLRDPVKILKNCDLMPKDYYESCILGALNVIVDFWGDKIEDQPHQLCKQLSEDNKKEFCYKQIGIRLVGIFGQYIDKIKKVCSYSEASFEKSCLQSLNLN